MVFTLPAAFPVTGLGVIGLTFLNFYQMGRVSAARKESGVKYPNLYATDAEAAQDAKKYKFNCTQRTHANTLEYVPYILALFGYLSFFHPKAATSSVLIWVVGRFFYTIQYAAGNPDARNNGLALLAYVGLLGLLGGSLYVTATEGVKVLLN